MKVVSEYKDLYVLYLDKENDIYILLDKETELEFEFKSVYDLGYFLENNYDRRVKG